MTSAGMVEASLTTAEPLPEGVVVAAGVLAVASPPRQRRFPSAAQGLRILRVSISWGRQTL